MGRLLIEVMKSNYCKLVFLLAAIVAYLLIPPSVVKAYPWLAGAFILAFGLVVACSVRNMKERITTAKAAANGIAAISALLGLSALQVCIAGFCSSAAVGLVALFPAFLSFYIEEHAFEIALASVAIQLISLYVMGCFKTIGNLKVSFSLEGGGKGL